MDPKILHRLPVALDNKTNVYENVNSDKFFYSIGCKTFRGRPLVPVEFSLSSSEKQETTNDEKEECSKESNEKNQPNKEKFIAKILKIDQDTKKVKNIQELDKIVEYQYCNWSKSENVGDLGKSSRLESACLKLAKISDALA